MKKTIFFILMSVLLISSNSFPQFRLKIGPLTGLNFNIGTGSDLPQTVTGFGITFGAQVDMRFTPVIGIISQIEFYDNLSGGYSETGNFQFQDGVFPATVNVDYSLAYFMIEPLLKMNIPASGFYFLVGPAIGFNVQGSISQSITPQGGQTQKLGTITIQNTNVRFAIKAGAGYDIPVSSLVTLTPQFTFGYGITTIQSDFSARIMIFQIAAIAKFKLI